MKLRAFYAQYTADGTVPLGPYVAATIWYRDRLVSGAVKIDEVAAKEKLNARYLGALWGVFTVRGQSLVLDSIQKRWQASGEKESDALAKDLESMRAKLWNVVPIGSYRDGNLSRQAANNSIVAETQTVRLAYKPAAGVGDVTLYLSAADVIGKGDGHVIWGKPRFEAEKKSPLLLSDYAKFGSAYEVDYAALFADTAKYLAAVEKLANDGTLTAADIAAKDGLELPLLKRWVDLLALPTRDKARKDDQPPMRMVPTVALETMGEKITKNNQRAAINGWRSKGGDLPVLLSNSSDAEEHIPGRAPAHKVVVHPLPKEFVAVTWTSPVDATVRVGGNVFHAHPNCGNGVAWWLEFRHDERAGVIQEGTVELGGQVLVPVTVLKVAKGDSLVFAIDAKNGDHTCDLTEIGLTITETDKPGRVWDLSADVADNILLGNPHSDKLGNADVWRFVKGPSRPLGKNASSVVIVPTDSELGRWRDAAIDPRRSGEVAALAQAAQSLLSGARPAKEKAGERLLFDRIVTVEGPLLQGLDASHWPRKDKNAAAFALEAKRFGGDIGGKAIDSQSIAATAGSTIEIHLPAGLLAERQFVVDGRLADDSGDHAVRFEVLLTPTNAGAWDGKSPLVASAGGEARKAILKGLDDFRSQFPLFICFPAVIPVDEVVCLKMYHREDEPLKRLFLNDDQRKQIDRLWEEHRFISQQPIAENKYLPLFIGFVTQDQTKEMLAYYEGQREPFRKRG